MRVYPQLIHYLFSPYLGLADDESEVEVYRQQSGEEDSMHTLIVSRIKEAYSQLPPAMARGVRAALAYYLIQPSAHLEQLWGSMLLPFEAPKDFSAFFQRLWHELFGNTSPRSEITEHDIIDFSIPTTFDDRQS